MYSSYGREQVFKLLICYVCTSDISVFISNEMQDWNEGYLHPHVLELVMLSSFSTEWITTVLKLIFYHAYRDA